MFSFDVQQSRYLETLLMKKMMPLKNDEKNGAIKNQ